MICGHSWLMVMKLMVSKPNRLLLLLLVRFGFLFQLRAVRIVELFIELPTVKNGSKADLTLFLDCSSLFYLFASTG